MSADFFGVGMPWRLCACRCFPSPLKNPDHNFYGRFSTSSLGKNLTWRLACWSSGVLCAARSHIMPFDMPAFLSSSRAKSPEVLPCYMIYSPRKTSDVCDAQDLSTHYATLPTVARTQVIDKPGIGVRRRPGGRVKPKPEHVIGRV